MKLSQFINLRAEDYPNLQDGPRLFSVLNPLFTQLKQIFDSNIDFDSNIRSVTVPFNQTGIALPMSFAWPYTQFTPRELVVLQATVSGTDAVLLPAWHYDASTSQIVVTSLFHVTANSTALVGNSSVYKFQIRVSV